MANITDVAKLAGVSHQTVSRVLNEQGTVRPVTRARVNAAIRELNYRPSAAARALVTRKTKLIGLITTGAPLYGPSSTTLAFNEAARAAGYQVSIASMGSTDREAMVEAVDVLLGQNVQALVLIATDVSALAAITGVDIGVPLVTAESSGRDGFHSVSIDQYAGARLATRHLIELGHRDILHVAGPLGSIDAAQRERGWRDEVAAVGLFAAPPFIGTWNPASGYWIGSELVNRELIGRGGASAIFSANDQMAVGLLHALSDAGFSAPGDVSIVGFDDIPESAHLVPPLTTVRQDFAALGERMMETLLSVLDDHAPGPPSHTEPFLIVRDSTAPPPVTEP